MRAEVLGRYTPGPPLPNPHFLSLAECGFPSPADDAVDRVLDLNEFVVQNPPATYFLRAVGESMLGAGIHDGDVLVVDRSREVESGNVVVAAIHGELTVKRVRIKSRKGGRIEALWLVPENEAFPLVAVTEGMGVEVWGVVTHVLHPLTKDLAQRVPEEGVRVRGDGRAGEPPPLPG
jgi:DNA polymerase V